MKVAAGEPARVATTDAIPDLRSRLTGLRGALVEKAPLADLTWFRVGGAAELLFQPADEADLSAFLKALPGEAPVTVIGLGSNLIVRDGGVKGAVARLSMRGFGRFEILPGHRVRVGAAMPDMRFARACAEAGIAGLSFFVGIPGGIGGALRMNAGAYGGETKDRLVELRALDRQGEPRVIPAAEMGYAYRHSSAASDLVFTEAVFQGEPGDPAALRAEMAAITARREASQPIRDKTGGSTFKNPPGAKAWELIDAAGCRGLAVGDAQVSEKHCNFLINRGRASARDIERLGEVVRGRVLAKTGIRLEWEIKRLGVFRDGEEVSEFDAG